MIRRKRLNNDSCPSCHDDRVVTKGFTLLEMTLVLIVMAGIFLAAIQYENQFAANIMRKRTATEMQQILNAGLTYYVNNGAWPITCGFTNGVCTGTCFTGLSSLEPNYLPNYWGNYYPSPYNTGYYVIECDAVTNTFSVVVKVDKLVNAKAIAGMIPLGTYGSTSSAGWKAWSGIGAPYVTASVSLPLQNMSTAPSVDFASIYTSGECVPKPNCPSNMTAEILVIPVSVSGNYSSTSYYPLTGYTAYAKSAAATPANCDYGSNDTCSKLTSASSNFWRVCLDVSTSNGSVNPSSTTNTINMGNILAIVRCVPSGEASSSGSDFTVYGK